MATSLVKERPVHGPYTNYLKSDALKGKRFGVPAFIMNGAGIPFEGIPASDTREQADKKRKEAEIPLRAETRAAFMKAIEGLRAAGATVVFDDSILPDSFAETASRICTLPYIKEGTDHFLNKFGAASFHSAAEYEKAIGSALPETIIDGMMQEGKREGKIPQRILETDPDAQANYFGPLQRTLAAYNEALDRLHLDGFVYPAIQMPPPDETLPQDGQLSSGPHSDTSWVNMRALALDDQLSEAHSALGFQLMLDYDFAAAERELKRAVELNPNNARAYQVEASLLMMLGKCDQALVLNDRAIEIEPTVADIRNGRAGILVAAGKTDEAIAYIKENIRMDPEFAWSHSHLSVLYRMKGDHAASVEERARADELLDMLAG